MLMRPKQKLSTYNVSKDETLTLVFLDVFQQRSQQTKTSAFKADFAESTAALSTGLSRRQQQSTTTMSKMSSSTMETSSSTQQVNIKELI